jgi:alpha-N-arabinofuranosidase
MKCYLNKKRVVGTIDPMIYGHFAEHFHRQIYGGIYDPTSRFADEDGFRTDVLEAMRNIKVPILRWPGGCFVSSYNWKKAVGEGRVAVFDKSWRIEDPNTFGTDEYVKLCRKIGCEPYICTNAGTGTAEEMSDWVEYCNLKNEGEFAKWRIANGYSEPHNIKYWSIGNENWGAHEIGARDTKEWGRLVAESAKMMLHVDPSIQLSAAALTDIDWNVNLLKMAGKYLKWISIHEYFDRLSAVYAPSDYETAMARTARLGKSIESVRGTLMMFGLDKQIRIAFDEWNLRGWHHPFIHKNLTESPDIETVLKARDKNDTNSTYTTADSVFTACFLNDCIRNCDIVGMANFAPVVNTTGAIFTHENGIVKRSTYYVFELMTRHMGESAIGTWIEDVPVEAVSGEQIKMIDVAAATRKADGALTVSAVNKHDVENRELELVLEGDGAARKTVTVYTLNGASKDSYNDIDSEQVGISVTSFAVASDTVKIELPPHSVNMIVIEE